MTILARPIPAYTGESAVLGGEKKDSGVVCVGEDILVHSVRVGEECATPTLASTEDCVTWRRVFRCQAVHVGRGTGGGCARRDTYCDIILPVTFVDTFLYR